MLFVLLSTIYFVAIFIFKHFISKASKRTDQVRKRLMPMVSAFLFHEQNAATSEQIDYAHLKMEMRSLLKNKFHQKVLTGILLELRMDLSGSSLAKLFVLYKDLDLHLVAYKKLRSWRWEIVSHGILELTKMEVAESYGFLTKFINDKRPTIRKQAEIAVVTLRPEGLDYFLDTTSFKISEWQQLKLLEVIRTREDYLPPRYKSWLTSKNKYVVLFALRLIKHFHQNDATASIIELVKHRNNQIKLEAIDCIRTFHMTLALETLKTVFWRCTAVVKIAILQAIGSLGTDKELDFLNLIEKKEANFTVRSKALSAINLISPESILPTDGILDTSKYVIPEDLAPKDIQEMPDEWLFEEQFIDSVENVPETKSEIEPDISPITATFNLNEIEVCRHEEFLIGDPEATQEVQKIGPDETHKIDFTIDFLPYVVADGQETPVPAKSTSEQPVEFEEIKSKPPMKQAEELQKPLRFGLKTEELNFVPLVVADGHADDIESTSDESAHIDVGADRLMDMMVDFELIKTEAVDNPPNQKDSYLSLEVDYEFIEVLPEETNITMAITDLDVEYEIILPSSFDAMNDLEIDTGILPNDDSIADLQLPEWLLKQLGSDNPIDLGAREERLEENEAPTEPVKTVADCQKLLMPIPARKTYDKEVEVQMHLLEDIELFGDTREIELLKELLANAEHPVVKERIADLLSRFSEPMAGEMPADFELLELDNQMPKFSIFSELFRHSDTESKLILLKEIATVGDEKEVAFLKELSEDPEPQIRELAAKALLKLEALMADKPDKKVVKSDIGTNGVETVSTNNDFDPLINEMEVCFNRSLNIFDIGFEMALAEEPMEEDCNQVGQQDEPDASLWKVIKVFAQKLIEKTYG
ncbi:MAG: HEAT repeat domain-containing protein [Flavobacteriaceae bacterium]